MNRTKQMIWWCLDEWILQTTTLLVDTHLIGWIKRLNCQKAKMVQLIDGRPIDIAYHATIFVIGSVFHEFVERLLERRDLRSPGSSHRRQRAFARHLLVKVFQGLENLIVVYLTDNDHAQVVWSEMTEYSFRINYDCLQSHCDEPNRDVRFPSFIASVRLSSKFFTCKSLCDNR